MNRRGASALPKNVRVSVTQIQGLVEDLDKFLVPYKPFWGERSEPRETGCQYLRGLIANVPRKSAEPLAELFDKERKTFQRFVGTNAWPDQMVRHTMQRDIADTLGHPDGVLVFDPSAFPKQGKCSVGVARQWCGTRGKIENCQVGCFLSYASPRGSSLIDGTLYLPKEWASKKSLREMARIPANIGFAKKWEIADHMLEEFAPKFPHSRILADAEYGRCGELRDRLSGRQEAYLMDIPNNLEIRVYNGPFLIPAPTTPEAWAERALGRVWKRFNIRDTTRGALLLEGIMIKVATIRDDGSLRKEILVVKRDLATGELKYALANDLGKVSLRRLLQDWSRRHTIEECFQRAKSDLGMDHYEVRSWVGWHHHITMALLALWFLERERIKRCRSFSPSDGFAACVDHGGTHSTDLARPENAGEESHQSPKKVFNRAITPCGKSKRIKIMQNGPSETVVKTRLYG